MMKRLLASTVFVSILLGSVLRAAEPMPELDLFLCIGQSNMAGRGPLQEPLGDFRPVEGVFLFTPDGKWEPAANPLNKYSTVRKEPKLQRMSLPYAFAKRIARTTGRPIGLVVNARGGTSIDEWSKGNKGKFNLYEEAIQRARNAGQGGRFRAILWHQGESDVGRLDSYPEKLRKLVADLRADLGDETLFFVAGEIARWKRDADGVDPNAGFNTMIRGIDTWIERSACISSEDLAPLGYNWKDPHFDRESLLILGDRYAETVLRNIYGNRNKKK